MPYAILLLWVCSHVNSNVFLQNSSDAIPRCHGALPDPGGTYQVLQSLALGLRGELRRHGDDFSVSDDYGPERVKRHVSSQSHKHCDFEMTPQLG